MSFACGPGLAKLQRANKVSASVAPMQLTTYNSSPHCYRYPPGEFELTKDAWSAAMMNANY
jgi:hypothetical protein